MHLLVIFLCSITLLDQFQKRSDKTPKIPNFRGRGEGTASEGLVYNDVRPPFIGRIANF